MKLAPPALLALAACLGGAPPSAEPAPRGPVVVELFSSEGCSSCPPADATLRALASRPDVLALEYHVDYWDSIGWVDPFAQPSFGDRHGRYARALAHGRVGTPQVFVDGAEALPRARAPEAEVAIARAAARPHVEVRLARVEARPDGVTLEITTGAAPASGAVMLAITEADLTTVVPRGENAGRTLTHAPVVRRLQELGRVTAGGRFHQTIQVTLDPAWDPARVRVVAFLQEPTGAIVGAGALAAA